MVPKNRNGQVLVELCLMIGLLLGIFLCVVLVNQNHEAQAKKYEFKNTNNQRKNYEHSEDKRKNLFKHFQNK